MQEALSAVIKVSAGSFSFAIDNPFFWISVAFIAFFFLFRWGLKRFLIFIIVLAGSLFLMEKADTYIINLFGKEEGEFYALLTKPLFIFICGFLFIYYTFINKE